MSEFEFDLDREKRLLTVVMHGFWNAQTCCAYDAQMRAQLAALGRLPAPRACLVDARDFAIQSKEVADLLQDGVAKRLSLYPERTVRLVSRAISRGQAARMTNDPSHRVYDSIDEALGWLLEQRAAA